MLLSLPVIVYVIVPGIAVRSSITLVPVVLDNAVDGAQVHSAQDQHLSSPNLTSSGIDSKVGYKQASNVSG
jgi:hypothetical protein